MLKILSFKLPPWQEIRHLQKVLNSVKYQVQTPDL